MIRPDPTWNCATPMEYRFQEIACAVTRKSCPICLCRLHHGSAAVIIPCMHAYCILCIRRWSDVKRKCPLCNADFGSWFSKISFSSLTFREEKLSAPAETKKLHSGFLRSTLSNRLAHRRLVFLSLNSLINYCHPSVTIYVTHFSF